MPSLTDFTDPLYNKKYVHNMPPLEAYRFRPPSSLFVNTKEKQTVRLYFYGWNNITDFEIQQIAEIKKNLIEVLKV